MPRFFVEPAQVTPGQLLWLTVVVPDVQGAATPVRLAVVVQRLLPMNRAEVEFLASDRTLCIVRSCLLTEEVQPPDERLRPEPGP